MSSSTVAYSDSSILSDDMLTSLRLDASGEAPYDSGLDAEGEEVSEDDYWTLEEAQAAMAAMAVAEHGNGATTPKRLGPTVASHSKNKNTDDEERCTNDARFNLEESERALYGDESDDEKEAASVSTVPKASNRKSLPSTSRAKNNAVKREPPKNVSPEQHGSDDMQIDATGGCKALGLDGTSTTAIQGGSKSIQSRSKREVDLSRICSFMPPHDRYKYIDAFMQLYMSSSSSERERIHTRLAECEEEFDVGVTPIAADLPPVMAGTEDCGEVDLSAPARSVERWQTYPVNQMQQSDGTEAGGVDVIDVTELTSDFDEFKEEGSSRNAPGFNASYQSHAPAGSNFNNIVTQYEFYGRGYSSNSSTFKHSVKPTEAQPYSSSYGPPTTTYAINQLIEGSSRDGLQPSTRPLTSIRSPPNNHKRPHGLGWGNGRPPLRQRVASSPGYIESSRRSPIVPPPSGPSRSSPPLPIDTKESQRKINLHLVDEFFIPRPEIKGSFCVYKTSNGKTCNKFVSSVILRNARGHRLRHLASHARKEEDAVAKGRLKMEDALLLTRFKKVVVACAVPGCDFSREVWHMDGALAKHEKEAHVAMFEERVQAWRQKRGKKEIAKEDR